MNKVLLSVLVTIAVKVVEEVITKINEDNDE